MIRVFTHSYRAFVTPFHPRVSGILTIKDMNVNQEKKFYSIRLILIYHAVKLSSNQNLPLGAKFLKVLGRSYSQFRPYMQS